MVARSFTCDANRLKSFLDDDLSEQEQLNMTDHLDSCSDCQRALERLAAGTGLMDELKNLRARHGEPGAGFAMPGTALYDDGRASEPASARDHSLDFLASSLRAGLAGPIGALRSDRSARPGRLRRGAQGVRPGARPGGRHQGAGSAACHQRRGPRPVRPRGASSRRGGPRKRRRHPRGGFVEQPPLPGHAVRRRPVAPRAGRARRTDGFESHPAHRHPDGAGTGQRTPRAWCIATSSRRIFCWKTESSASSSPISAWPARSTMPV